METSGWVKAAQAMAGIARLLPASVLSAFLVVMAAAFLGSWGSVVGGLAPGWPRGPNPGGGASRSACVLALPPRSAILARR